MENGDGRHFVPSPIATLLTTLFYSLPILPTLYLEATKLSLLLINNGMEWKDKKYHTSFFGSLRREIEENLKLPI